MVSMATHSEFENGGLPSKLLISQYVNFGRYVINVFIHACTWARDLCFGLIFIDYVPKFSVCSKYAVETVLRLD